MPNRQLPFRASYHRETSCHVLLNFGDSDWTQKAERTRLATTPSKNQLRMKRAGGKNRRRGQDVSSIRHIAADGFQVRRATPRDADIIAWHRARMFQDMGAVAGEAFEILRTKARINLEQWLKKGRYIGWLAS